MNWIVIQVINAVDPIDFTSVDLVLNVCHDLSDGNDPNGALKERGVVICPVLQRLEKIATLCTQCITSAVGFIPAIEERIDIFWSLPGAIGSIRSVGVLIKLNATAIERHPRPSLVDVDLDLGIALGRHLC